MAPITQVLRFRVRQLQKQSFQRLQAKPLFCRKLQYKGGRKEQAQNWSSPVLGSISSSAWCKCHLFPNSSIDTTVIGEIIRQDVWD